MNCCCCTSRGSSLSDEARPWLRFNANDWFSWCFDWILSSADYSKCHHPSWGCHRTNYENRSYSRMCPARQKWDSKEGKWVFSAATFIKMAHACTVQPLTHWEQSWERRSLVGGPTVICIPTSMTSRSRKRRTRWDLYEDFTVLCNTHRNFACMKMYAFFHWESRLRSTFSKDGVRGSLHLATANAISVVLSSGTRATSPRNGARNAYRNKENTGRIAGKRPFRDNHRDIFLFDTDKLSTSVNPRASIYNFAKYSRDSDCSARYSLEKKILVFLL